MSFTKDQLLALMNTIDFATDNDASYEEYTILQSGTSDLEPIRDILYNEYITKEKTHDDPKEFMEQVYEIAYGEEAYFRGFFPRGSC